MAAAPTKTSDQKPMKPHVNDRETSPAGMARLLVRGFLASMSASTTRLNAIAAERAATMATTIQKNF